MSWNIILATLLVVGILAFLIYVVISTIEGEKTLNESIEKSKREAEEYMFKSDLKGIMRNLNEVESDLFELEVKPVEKKEYGEICSELREEIGGLILKYRAKIREIENEENK